MRAKYTVQWSPVVIERDDLNNEVARFGPVQEIPAYGWSLGGKDGVGDNTPLRVIYDAVLYIPSRYHLSDGDQVQLPSVGSFTVVGEPGNWDASPWWSPMASSVQLRRVDGD